MGLGVGAGAVDRVYKDMDTEVEVAPTGFFKNDYISVAGPSVDLALGSVGPIDVSVGMRYLGEGYKSSDARILEGMDARKSALWGTASAVWMGDDIQLSATAFGDMSGHSKGSKLRLAVAKRFDDGRLSISPRLALDVLSSEYVDYFYGVKVKEQTALRSSFHGATSGALEVGVDADYVLAKNHSLIADISSTWFGEEITDSPLVGEHSEVSAFVGYVYSFQ